MNVATVKKKKLFISHSCVLILIVDGHFDSWGSWGACSATCGGGIQARSRGCLFDAVAPHGLNCSGDFDETQTCNRDLCPGELNWFHDYSHIFCLAL